MGCKNTKHMTDNDFVCYLKCLSLEGCFFYTWYTSGVNSDKCFFFSSCDTINECTNEECVTGSIDFYILNPTTPATTANPTTTSTTPATTTKPTTTPTSPATTTNPTTIPSSAASLVPSLTFCLSLLLKMLFF